MIGYYWEMGLANDTNQIGTHIALISATESMYQSSCTNHKVMASS